MRLPSDCAIRLVDLPYSVGAMLVVDEEDFASIYLNSRLNRETQTRCLLHELRHVERDDMYSDKDIITVEGM